MTARLTAALIASAALLAACNDVANDGVRAGPQAVHPGTYAPARGPVAVAPVTTVGCGAAGEPDCAAAVPYTPVPGDGSRPIID
ncbi:hypothetical protein BOO69_13730 [Sulfitobacter alexandrii]|uniref:Lipoprotein n=1 Tax=Sulfitobacter alexandrii TaxID=1917485 RepID=A0A1J0WJJ3_9RHOB|nr:hypothetical protein [Sulfitobacter alexandrii]APE44344.1 hypothetical protein BOO69_13730 [Sulfitobacter alexandrii]